MANNDKYVGKPDTNLAFRQARNVPVVANKPRLNDLRKSESHPHEVSKPSMGILPKGGKQTAPKQPIDNVDIEARDVPVANISEAELLEWNPFDMFKRNPKDFYPGDAIAYQITKNGIDLFHVKDGKILSRDRYPSYDVLSQKMEELKKQYIAMYQDRRELSVNPNKSAKRLANIYANKLNIKPEAIGKIGSEVPVSFDAQDHQSSTSSNSGWNGFTAGPTIPSTTSNKNNRMTTPADFTIENPRETTKNAWGRPQFTSPPRTPSSKPNNSINDMPKVPVDDSRTWTSPKVPMNLGNDNNPNEKPRIKVKAGSQEVKPTTTGMDDFLRKVDPVKYNDKVLAGMTEYQKQQAIGKMKMRNARTNEGYPDTNYSKSNPSHKARIGSRHSITPENPTKPDLNREFAQFRDVNVEHIREDADIEIDQMLETTLNHMGLKGEYKKINTGKEAIHNPGSVCSVPKHGVNKLKGKVANGSQMEGLLPRTRQRWV